VQFPSSIDDLKHSFCVSAWWFGVGLVHVGNAIIIISIMRTMMLTIVLAVLLVAATANERDSGVLLLN
jgi:hypothetical protein